MRNPAKVIKVTAADNFSEDFPKNGFSILSIDQEYQVTDRICEECNGTRAETTHVFRWNEIVFEVDGTKLKLEEFGRKYPKTHSILVEGLEIGEFTNPTCTACQEDYRLRAKQLFNQDKLEK